MPFEKIKFMHETGNGAGRYSAEVWGWYRNTRGADHAAPDCKGSGAGDSPEAARTDAVRSLQRNDREGGQ